MESGIIIGVSLWLVLHVFFNLDFGHVVKSIEEHSPNVEPDNDIHLIQTSKSDMDFVIEALTKIGVKKPKAAKVVSEMCNNKYYDDANLLFAACLPHIK